MKIIDQKQFFIDKLLKDKDISNLLRSVPENQLDSFLNDINQIRNVLHIKNDTDRIILNEYQTLITVPEGTENTLIRELHIFNREFYEEKLPKHYILDFDQKNNDYDDYYQHIEPLKNEENINIDSRSQKNNFNSKVKNHDRKSTTNLNDDTIDFSLAQFESDSKKKSFLEDGVSSTIENVRNFKNNFYSDFKEKNIGENEITRDDLFSKSKNNYDTRELIDLGRVDDELSEFDSYDLENNKKSKKERKKIKISLKKKEKKVNKKKNIEESKTSENFISSQNNNKKEDEDAKIISNNSLKNFGNHNSKFLSDPALIFSKNQKSSRYSELENIFDNNLKVNKATNFVNEILVEDELEKEEQLKHIQSALNSGQYGRLNLSRPMSLTCARYMRRLDNLKKGFERTYGSELLKKVTEWVKMENILYANIDSKRQLEELNERKFKLKLRKR